MDFSQYDDATRALAERTESMWDGFDTALIPTASKLLEIARGMGDTALEGFALYALAGGYYMFDPQGPGFTMAIREALACFQDVEDYTMVRRTYNLLAIHAILEGSHITGLDYLYESLNAFGGETNPYLRGIAETNIAHIYADLGAYPQAVLNAKRAIRDMLTGPDAENAHAQMNAIVCYCQLGGYQLELNPPAVADAQECYEQAELIASRMENLTKGIGITYHGFTGPNQCCIDYIFVSGAISGSDVRKWTDSRDGVFLSAHFPVSAELTLL